MHINAWSICRAGREPGGSLPELSIRQVRQSESSLAGSTIFQPFFVAANRRVQDDFMDDLRLVLRASVHRSWIIMMHAKKARYHEIFPDFLPIVPGRGVNGQASDRPWGRSMLRGAIVLRGQIFQRCPGRGVPSILA